MEKTLTEQELKARKMEIYQAIKKSNSELKDFCVHLAVYRGAGLAQVSILTEEEFLNMQKDINCDTPHLLKFLQSLKNKNNIRIETITLDENNFALAFNPAVWSVLKLEQKIAVCRFACKKINNVDVTEFSNYNSNGFVLVGKNYSGAFNLGAFYREDVEPIDLLKHICNFKNIIKDAYYINKSREKEYNTIFDFDSFEEMQYVSPLEPNKNFDDSSDKAKAFYWDQLYNRQSRKAYLQALDLVSDASQPIEDITKDFGDYVKNTIKDIVKTNVFVIGVLGYNPIERDRKYLDIKVEIFNNYFIKEFNSKADIYNNLLNEYNSTENENKKQNINEQLKQLKIDMENIEKNIITLAQAEEHFKKYFKSDKVDKNIVKKENDFFEEDEKMS